MNHPGTTFIFGSAADDTAVGLAMVGGILLGMAALLLIDWWTSSRRRARRNDRGG